MQHFERTSCNLENFKSLCESNHVLRSFGDDIDDYITNKSDTLRVVLDINARDAPVGTKIRSKFRQLYFVGEFNNSHSNYINEVFPSYLQNSHLQLMVLKMSANHFE